MKTLHAGALSALLLTGLSLTGCSATMTASMQETGSMVGSVSASTWTWRQIGKNPPVLDAAITASATGALQPYTYQWVYVSGDTQTRPLSGATPSTQFYRPTPPVVGATIQSVWKCKVTSVGGGVFTYTPTVTVSFTHS